MIPAVAVLLTLVAPGAGQIYLGNWGDGILLGVLFAFGKSVFLPLAIRLGKVSSLKSTLRLFYAFNCGYMALIVYAICSAVYQGFSAVQTHFWYGFLALLAISLGYRNTLNGFIFTLLSGRSGVYALLRNSKGTPTEKK